MEFNPAGVYHLQLRFQIVIGSSLVLEPTARHSDEMADFYCQQASHAAAYMIGSCE